MIKCVQDVCVMGVCLMDVCDELSERADCYRAYASQTLASARAAATEEMRITYLRMAEGWLKLAENTDFLRVASLHRLSPERPPNYPN